MPAGLLIENMRELVLLQVRMRPLADPHQVVLRTTGYP